MRKSKPKVREGSQVNVEGTVIRIYAWGASKLGIGNNVIVVPTKSLRPLTVREIGKRVKGIRASK